MGKGEGEAYKTSLYESDAWLILPIFPVSAFIEQGYFSALLPNKHFIICLKHGILQGFQMAIFISSLRPL